MSRFYIAQAARHQELGEIKEKMLEKRARMDELDGLGRELTDAEEDEYADLEDEAQRLHELFIDVAKGE